MSERPRERIPCAVVSLLGGLCGARALPHVGPYLRIRPYDDHMLFGEEMGRIARALATGFGFSDPFRGHTGPTAWVGPLFPLILGGVFRSSGSSPRSRRG